MKFYCSKFLTLYLKWHKKIPKYLIANEQIAVNYSRNMMKCLYWFDREPKGIFWRDRIKFRSCTLLILLAWFCFVFLQVFLQLRHLHRIFFTLEIHHHCPNHDCKQQDKEKGESFLLFTLLALYEAYLLISYFVYWKLVIIE